MCHMLSRKFDDILRAFSKASTYDVEIMSRLRENAYRSVAFLIAQPVEAILVSIF
jgi:hypothetical protein